MPIILALLQERQGDQEFKVILQHKGSQAQSDLCESRVLGLFLSQRIGLKKKEREELERWLVT